VATIEGGLEYLLSHYAVGRVIDAQRLEQGFVNENWKITTSRGRFFLKRRRATPGQASLVRAQHELIEYLGHQGFPAPSLMRTAAGETILTHDHCWYELQEYIDGEPYDHDRASHLQQSALTLGVYHSCVRGFAPRALCASGELYTPGSVGEMLERLGEAWQAERDPALAGLIQPLEMHVQELTVSFAGHGVLDRLVIHGDYYADNLIFKGDSIVGVVDYDRARREPRVAELAEALIYFSSPRRGQTRHIVYPGFLLWEPFSRFLEAYHDAHALEEADARALPDYVRAIWLYWSARRLLEAGARPDHALEALQELSSLVDWARDNADSMTEAALSALLR
jgi:Ser/Thr protein kinase RdoA (MazF antagonist)